MKLDRVLYSAVHYPGDYGFIPRTLHEDGDPLDVLVLVNEQTFPGCMIDVRPLGVLRMLDRGEPDDKILARRRCHDPYYEEFFDIADIPRHVLKEVRALLSRRTRISRGSACRSRAGRRARRCAMKVIKDSIARYDAAYMRLGLRKVKSAREQCGAARADVTRVAANHVPSRGFRPSHVPCARRSRTRRLRWWEQTTAQLYAVVGATGS